MCNYCKTFKEIIDTTPDISTYLIDAQNYYAHTPKSNSKNKTAETLEEHTKLVLQYFVKLVNEHHLEPIIDKLITEYLKQGNNYNIQLFNFLKTLFVNSIIFHDFGKVNENFQIKKMNNPYFEGKFSKNSPISTYHSSLGAFLFIYKHLYDVIKTRVSRENQASATLCVLLFSYPIFKHHNSKLSDDYRDVIYFDEKKEIDFI